MGIRNDNHFLHFSKGERIGILALLVLIIIAHLAPLFFNQDNLPELSINDLAWLEDTTSNRHVRYSLKENTETREATLFFFDPNTLDETGWINLGVKPFIVRNIEKYRQKGGRFKSNTDLKKIYGLTEEEVIRLQPFVQIKSELNTKMEVRGGQDNFLQKRIDVNAADSAEWESLPGIGAKLSVRIINFRTRLGGFNTVNQVGETYGLPDSVFQKIKPRLTIDAKDKLRLIDINTADVNELKQHPYIRYANAQLIVAFRNQHGLFKHIEDLKKIIGLDSGFVEKVGPYFKLTNEIREE
ncbi:MAG: helix-hairpin-helix domain-containing protein [Ferruginibacter sp.]|nr:helix-hairpin-helix domain-containing protein [Ferruginibacter sp.]